jgi:23S rRNA-intervening sequence protein
MDGPARKQQFLGYAIGSSLECAACLDIAVIKQLEAWNVARAEKRSLCEVVRMLVGLGRSWEKLGLHEEPAGYGGPPTGQPHEWYFAHEPLEVYQASLSFMRWFNGLPAGAELPSRLYREIDKAATSMILNLAEGYGRTGQGDRESFLERVESSAVKAAASIDLCVSKAELQTNEREPGIDLLRRIVLMVRALFRGLDP